MADGSGRNFYLDGNCVCMDPTAITVWLSAHALVIYAGMVPAIRAQLVYPFVLGYQIMFLLWYIRENKMNNFLMIDKVKYWGILLLTIVGIWQQAGNTFRLC